MKFLIAAAAVLKTASDIVTRFITKNTPESALLAALAAAYAGYTGGQLTGAQAFIAAISALVVFVYTESNKDAKTTTPSL